MDTTLDWQASSGFRGKLDTWKSRGLSKVHDLQHVVAHRRATVQDSMRTSPAKWAAIAAGTGFVLGLAGRIAEARKKRKHAMPALVIVETSC